MPFSIGIGLGLTNGGRGGGGGGAAAPLDTPYAAPTGWPTLIGNEWGLNLSGAEFDADATGVEGSTYFYPDTPQMNYFAGKGFGSIRAPIIARRYYKTAFGALDVAETAKLKAVVDKAGALGLKVILDPHDYGGMWDPDLAAKVLVGTTDRSSSLFADFWARLASKFKSYPNVIFGLMNEPTGQTADQWKTGATRAITAIRAAGATQKILIPGVEFTGAHAWYASGNAAAWAGFASDPLNNFEFEVHQYLDSANSGNTFQPGAAVVGKADFILANATTWARANGFKLHLGEWGIGTASDWLTAGQSLVDYIGANRDVWSGYSYWVGGTAYNQDTGDLNMVGPANLTTPVDRVQIPILRSIFTDTALAVWGSNLFTAPNDGTWSRSSSTDVTWDATTLTFGKTGDFIHATSGAAVANGEVVEISIRVKGYVSGQLLVVASDVATDAWNKTEVSQSITANGDYKVIYRNTTGAPRYIGFRGQGGATLQQTYQIEPLSLKRMSRGGVPATGNPNLLPNPQTFSNASWTKSGVTITEDATTAPDGTTTADKMVNSVASLGQVYRAMPGGTLTSGQSYVFSCYAKAAEYSAVLLNVYDNVSDKGVLFNLGAGTTSNRPGGGTEGASGVIDAGNGWKRCWFTFVAEGTTGGNANIYMQNPGAIDTGPYAIGSGLYIWGAKLEQASTFSAYPP